MTSFLQRFLSLCLLLSAASLHAATTPSLNLVGIVNLPDNQLALLEIVDFPGQPEYETFSQGQVCRYRKDFHFELIEVDSARGTAKFNITANQTNTITVLSLPADSQPSQATGQTNAPTVRLHNVPLDQALDLYGHLLNRTVLHPPLPSMEITCNISATNQTDAAHAFTVTLAKNELTNILDGTKFVMILRDDRASMAHPHSAEIKSSAPPPTNPPGTPKDIIPAGEINFPQVDVRQVCYIYSELIGRKFDFTAPFPRNVDFIHLRTQTPLSKEESRYALDTVLAWQNIKLVPIGKDSLQAVEIKTE